DGPDDLLQSKAEGFGTLAGADYRENIGVPALLVGTVNRPLIGVLGESRLPGRTDHADNGEGFALRLFVRATKHTMSDRVPLRPVESGKIFVHDADSPVAIPNIQESPVAERDAEGSED